MQDVEEQVVEPCWEYQLVLGMEFVRTEQEDVYKNDSPHLLFLEREEAGAPGDDEAVVAAAVVVVETVAVGTDTLRQVRSTCRWKTIAML